MKYMYFLFHVTVGTKLELCIVYLEFKPFSCTTLTLSACFFSALSLTAYNRASFFSWCVQYYCTTVDYITHKVSLLHKAMDL